MDLFADISAIIGLAGGLMVLVGVGFGVMAGRDLLLRRRMLSTPLTEIALVQARPAPPNGSVAQRTPKA